MRLQGTPNFSAKTALHKASFFALAVFVFFQLYACYNLSGDPAADGAKFNRRFYFYYAQDCRFDSIGSYDCSQIVSLSPSKFVGIRVDSDGLVSLNLNGDRFYYLESEYTEGYDPDYGGYFHFYQDDDELTIYKDGMTMAYWDNLHGIVTYYYYELY